MLKYLLILLALTPFALATYRVTQVSPLGPQGQRFVAQLVPGPGGPYGGDVAKLIVDVVSYTKDIVRVTMRDASASRWEVPDVVLLKPEVGVKPNLNVTIGNVGSNLNVVVTRLSDNMVIFDSSVGGGLVYENQYLTLDTVLPENPNIYGLGERAAPLRLPTDQVYTIFARDKDTPLMENVYGSHAFYMELRKGGAAHGVYLLNSNAMDVVLNATSLQYRVIGGIFDFFFIAGPTPKEVTRQYLSVIGTAELVPYWSLGWHQCRWGYNTLAETKTVVEQYARNGIPLEVMWNDIDYMDAYKDFTTDPVRFPAAELKSFVNSLHSNGQKYVMIIDPGIKIEAKYPAYEDGMRQGLYLRHNKTGKPIVGMVWPGFTFFPDFANPATWEYWHKYLAQFYEMIPYDGIWIDMNEVANFCDGNCLIDPPIPPVTRALSTSKEKRLKRTKPIEDQVREARRASMAHLVKQRDLQQQTKAAGHILGFDANNPPYKPYNGGGALNSHTLDMTAYGQLGMQYNVHTLYGHLEAKATRAAANRILRKRSLVISRSTFPGTGRYASHWLGDNHSTWQDLHLSISGVITLGLFGIPHVGADICGFVGNTSKELCIRWTQLGAWYTFPRNHNAVLMAPQEPYVFGPDAAKIATNIILLKYSFLPYYYTLHYHAHVTGDPVLRGLFYEFPKDTMTHDNDVQMMVGSGLLITPVLTESATIVNGYLPAGLWYDFYTGVQIQSNGQFVQLNAPIETINLHLRGGVIAPRQKPEMTTALSRLNPYELHVPLDASGSATGDLFADDGESFNTVTQHQYAHISFTHSASTLTITPIVSGYSSVRPVSTITFLGVAQQPSKVSINGQALSADQWVYTKSLKKLVVQNINIDLKVTSTVSWV